MLLNVKQLGADINGENTLQFEYALDMSDVRVWGGNPFKNPVFLKGMLRREIDFIHLDYSAVFDMEIPCLRCLEPVVKRYELEFFHSSAQDSGDEDIFMTTGEGMLDMDDVARGDILTSVDSTALCSPDCRGICPVCGGNRNISPCVCVVKEPDSRFAKLRELMD